MPRTILVSLCLFATTLAVAARPAVAACPNEAASASALLDVEFEDAVLCLVNERRAWFGRAPVSRNGALRRAAARHNQAMLVGGLFAHRLAGEPGPVRRVERSGYGARASRWAIGENLGWAWGSTATPFQVVAGWMLSPSHMAVLLGRRFRDIGLAAAHDTPDWEAMPNPVTITTEYGYRRR